MSKAFDVYNLDEDLENLLDEIATECDEPNSYVSECYELLSDRQGILDYIKRHDDALFYDCLCDLVSRRTLADDKLVSARQEWERLGIPTDTIYDDFEIETIDESVDNAIYNSYGSEAEEFCAPGFRTKLGYDEGRLTYEELGVSRGRRVLFKGGVPKDE